MKRLLMMLMVLTVTANALAQAPKPTLYIEPMEDGFDTYIAAAMLKKEVAVQVTTKEEGSTYTLKATKVEIKSESGAGKIARCLFAYCAGIADTGSTSVTLVSKDGIVLWSYSVNKGRGAANRQSMAEAIAKHLNNDYLKKKK
ncbi:MAG: hypothetical protein WDN47_04260 [Candidatus Doudnabacteria bacterium]